MKIAQLSSSCEPALQEPLNSAAPMMGIASFHKMAAVPEDKTGELIQLPVKRLGQVTPQTLAELLAHGHQWPCKSVAHCEISQLS